MIYTDSVKGTGASIASSCIFGATYYYVTLLAPLDGMDVFGWRMMFMVPLLALYIRHTGEWELVASTLRRVKGQKSFALLLCLSSFLLGLQLWLFLWAPLNGKALEVSLGYLLMPLVMVVCGRFVYKDVLEPYQRLAVLSAALGVGNQVWQTGAVSVETLAVALGFPAYFVLRRSMGANHLGGAFIDMALMLPSALFILYQSPVGLDDFLARPALFGMVPVLGIITAVAFTSYLTASKLLPMSLFGLLGYVEPVLLVVVSLLLGESIPVRNIPTYALVFLAVLLLALGGVRSFVRMRAVPR